MKNVIHEQDERWTQRLLMVGESEHKDEATQTSKDDVSTDLLVRLGSPPPPTLFLSDRTQSSLPVNGTHSKYRFLGHRPLRRMFPVQSRVLDRHFARAVVLQVFQSTTPS